MDATPQFEAEFINALYPFYEQAGVLARFEQDVTYLARTYARTEELWQENYRNIKEVKLIILAEAPLFGAEESYIYNPISKLTNFLWPGDLKGIVGRETSGLPKPEYLSFLQELGILIVDIFPYALNEKYTALVYNNSKIAASLTAAKKRMLAARVLEFYLRPKLEQIANRGAQHVRFCARYKPIGEIARAIYPPLLAELGFAPSEFTGVYMQGGMIDQKKFRDEYFAAQK